MIVLMVAAVIATEELPDGYAFRVPGDRKWVAIIAEMIVAERECCPFLTIELVAQPGLGPVTVRVTGPVACGKWPPTRSCVKPLLTVIGQILFSLCIQRTGETLTAESEPLLLGRIQVGRNHHFSRSVKCD